MDFAVHRPYAAQPAVASHRVVPPVVWPPLRPGPGYEGAYDTDPLAVQEALFEACVRRLDAYLEEAHPCRQGLRARYARSLGRFLAGATRNKDPTQRDTRSTQRAWKATVARAESTRPQEPYVDSQSSLESGGTTDSRESE